MKRLLLLTQDFPFGVGEASFLLPELPYLTERFEVTVAPSRFDGPQTTPLPECIRILGTAGGNALHAFFRVLLCPDFRRELGQGWRLGGGPRMLIKRAGFIYYNYLHAFRRFFALQEALPPDARPDQIYSYWAWDTAYTALLLKKACPGAKAVIRAHGYDLYRERSPLLWQPFRSAIGERADRVSLISLQGRDYWLKEWGKPAGAPPAVDYLGCTERESAYCPGKLSVVSCSLIGSVKRVELIVQALALMDVPLRWTHFGDGPQMERTVALAQRLLQGKANIEYEFAGRAANAALAGEYRARGANLFLNVSSSEGLPVSMMEAAAMGLPLMGTDVGGVAEIVTPQTGVLLPGELTPETLARALTEYARLDQAHKAGLSQGAHSRWEERFNAARNAMDFAQALTKLTEDETCSTPSN